MPFPIIVDGIGNEVRKLYGALTNPAFIVDRKGVIVYNSSWTWAPDLEQALSELAACERAKAKRQMVRMCYSEKLVGLTRDREISASVHRRAGPDAVKHLRLCCAARSCGSDRGWPVASALARAAVSTLLQRVQNLRQF